MKRLLAHYDLRCAPLSFDFAGYLACLVCHATKNGYDKIMLCINAQQYRRTNAIEGGYPDGYEDRKVRNVLIALAGLVPMIDDVVFTKSGLPLRMPGSFPENYDPAQTSVSSLTLMPCTPKDVIAVGGNPRVFHATAPGLAWVGRQFPHPYITLTLRNTPHNPARNCSLSAFRALYDALVAAGHNVVVIPDQDDLLGANDTAAYHWILANEAAMDLELRMALYDRAVLNVAWASGNAAMLLYSDAPYILFGMWNEAAAVSSRGFFDRKGPAFGEQLPWALPTQRLDWTAAAEASASLMAETIVTFLGEIK